MFVVDTPAVRRHSLHWKKKKITIITYKKILQFVALNIDLHVHVPASRFPIKQKLVQVYHCARKWHCSWSYWHFQIISIIDTYYTGWPPPPPKKKKKKTEQSIQLIFQDFALINSYLFSPCWIEHLLVIGIFEIIDGQNYTDINNKEE